MAYIGANGSRGAAAKASQPSIRQDLSHYVLGSDKFAFTTTNAMIYYICRMTADGQWEGLRSTHDADYAENILDFYCDKWPHAYIDILTHDEYHGGKVKWQQMAI